MRGFSLGVQSTSLTVLLALLVYTLALMRSGRLTAHVTVRWVLAEVAALGAVLLWGKLPVITYTSSLGDRELLVILAVLFFALIAFLMLDSLQRISAQAVQIRRLTQELALLRASQFADGVNGQTAVRPDQRTEPVPREEPAERVGLLGQLLLAAWIIGCLVLYVVQGEGRLPAAIARLLTAGYRQ